MELQHIPFEQLHLSPLNMRQGKRVPYIADILPTVRKRGILQPLLVRPNADGFEIIAGKRRYYCAKAVKEELGEIAPLPCAVMEAGDDAAAIEASLIENVARLDPDEMTQYETFTRLIREGRSVESIAVTFGLTEIMVKQRLALGNLLPKIREAYRADNIDAESLRYLTMATKTRQKEWLVLFEVEDGNAPFGHRLRQWLFGGQSIAVKAALFPLEAYTGQIVTDLFGEDSYFADTGMFWELQNKAIEAKREALLAAKWPEVVVLEVGERFDQWAYEKTPKKKGGKVFVTVSQRGEVEVHEGWLSRREARKSVKEKVETDGKTEAPVGSAMTQAMENYIELHRHAAVRLALLASPDIALRLLVAHAVASSGNWTVKADPQRTRSDAIKANIAQSLAEVAFDSERDEVWALLALPENDKDNDETRTARVFARLLSMSESDVQRIAAFVTAETLAVGSASVEAAGVVLKVDPRTHWQPDSVFFDLIRDRATINAMVAETAGKEVAKGNSGEKGATQKQIVRDALEGRNGRAKVEGWIPGWMIFPFRAYGTGSCRIRENAATVARLLRKG